MKCIAAALLAAAAPMEGHALTERQHRQRAGGRRRHMLVRYRDMLVTLRGRVGQGIAAGRTLDQIKARAPCRRLRTARRLHLPDALIETIYRSLRAAPYADPH